MEIVQVFITVLFAIAAGYLVFSLPRKPLKHSNPEPPKQKEQIMTFNAAIPANIHIGDKVLVTCDNWFFAPDGQQYRAVHGTLKAVRTAEDTLGIRPNGKSTNWYLEVGNMVIAGCQVHYVMKADTCTFDRVEQRNVHEGRVITSTAPTSIYNGDEA